MNYKFYASSGSIKKVDHRRYQHMASVVYNEYLPMYEARTEFDGYHAFDGGINRDGLIKKWGYREIERIYNMIVAAWDRCGFSQYGKRLDVF